MLTDASKEGFSESRTEELFLLVLSHKNIFRTNFSAGPTAKVPPLVLDLKPNAVPFIVKIPNTM